VAKLGQRLEPLEQQFDLPAQPIPVENLHRTKSKRSKGSKDDDVLGVLKGVWLQDLPFL